MTANNIAFWDMKRKERQEDEKLAETKRHNLNQEERDEKKMWVDAGTKVISSGVLLPQKKLSKSMSLSATKKF